MLRKRYPFLKEGFYLSNAEKKLINFGSNDYLGLSQDEEALHAFQEGINKWGWGSGGSAYVCGYATAHEEAEEKLALYLNQEKALLVGSGYVANLIVFSTFFPENTPLLMDKLCHASIYDGIKLGGLKNVRRYRHNDLMDFQSLHTEGCWTVTESLFSMEGDYAPLQSFKSPLIVDHSHGIGLFDLPEGIDLVTASLGKAFGGMGGVIAGSREMMTVLLQKARPLIYTTALPPAVACGVGSLVDIIRHSHGRRDQLRKNIEYFRAGMKESRSTTSQIQPFYGSFKENPPFFVPYIQPPSVQRSHYRISLSAFHSHEDIKILLNGMNP